MRHVDPYLPAEKLGLSEGDRQILIGLARDLESSKVIHLWGMGCWSTCICGQMEKRGAKPITDRYFMNPTHKLFFTSGAIPMSEITQQQAAKACYNFLTTGEPHWKESCS